MAATKLTINKKRSIENVLFWIAQQQGDCPICKSSLLPNAVNSDVYEITFDHASGSYDHAKKQESVAPMGGTLMHRSCHKSKTMKEKKVWLYKKEKVNV